MKPTILTKENELEIIRDYTVNNITIDNIRKKFKVRIGRITKILKENNIQIDKYKFLRTKLSDLDEQNIIHSYIINKENVKNIITKYHIDQNTFYKILKKYGYKTRKSNDTRTIILTNEQFDTALKIYLKFNSLKMAAKYIKVRASIIKRNFIERGVDIKIKKHSTVSMEKWILLHGKEKAQEMWNKWYRTIKTRNAGEKSHLWGKPPKQGCGTGWKGWYKNHYFRSLRELSYMIYLDENNIKWETAESKKLTINYINFDGRKRTYRADFLVNNIKLVEIKPKKLHNSPSVLAKRKGAEEFCKNNNLIYEIIDIEIYPQKIKDYLNNGVIKFDRDYETKFLEFFNKN